MSSASRVSDVSMVSQQPQVATLGWALRRAAIGLLMLIVVAMLGAWLLWASIDPDEASAADAPDSGEITAPQR